MEVSRRRLYLAGIKLRRTRLGSLIRPQHADWSCRAEHNSYDANLTPRVLGFQSRLHERRLTDHCNCRGNSARTVLRLRSPRDVRGVTLHAICENHRPPQQTESRQE